MTAAPPALSGTRACAWNRSIFPIHPTIQLFPRPCCGPASGISRGRYGSSSPTDHETRPSTMTIEPTPSHSLDAHGRGYPRPLLQRDQWYSLNGPWQFAADHERRWKTPADVIWNEQIIVPFAPEAPASGIGRTSFLNACWYRRQVTLPAM